MKELMRILLIGIIGAAAAVAVGMAVLFISSFALIKLGEKTEAAKKRIVFLCLGHASADGRWTFA